MNCSADLGDFYFFSKKVRCNSEYVVNNNIVISDIDNNFIIGDVADLPL